MSFVTGLQCRECGQQYPQEPLHVCELCFGPLEIQYDYAAIKAKMNRADDRFARAQSVALPRASADRRRAAGRLVFRFYAARARAPFG